MTELDLINQINNDPLMLQVNLEAVGGEYCNYIADGQSPRSVLMVVNRQLPQKDTNGRRIITSQMSITCMSNARTGIPPSTAKLGSDVVQVAIEVGGSLVSKRLQSIESQDPGLVTYILA